MANTLSEKLANQSDYGYLTTNDTSFYKGYTKIYRIEVPTAYTDGTWSYQVTAKPGTEELFDPLAANVINFSGTITSAVQDIELASGITQNCPLGDYVLDIVIKNAGNTKYISYGRFYVKCLAPNFASSDPAIPPTTELSTIAWGNITGDITDQTDLVEFINNALPPGSGEANTASNVGTAGVGVFKQKVGVNLQFKKLNAASDKVIITDDTANDEIDIDVSIDKVDLGLGNVDNTSDADKPISNATQEALSNFLTAESDPMFASSEASNFVFGDKSKLDGIAPGAEVNVKADWNAVDTDAEILNKPTIPSQYTDELAQDAIGNILTDSAEINFIYNDTTPTITASIVAGSIDESKLDASVNTSLDLADSALQTSAIGTLIQGFSSILSATTASFTTGLKTLYDAASTWVTTNGDNVLNFISSATSIFQYKVKLTVGYSNADYIVDGTADDVQIQAAIDAVFTLGGGEVVVKPGTYNIIDRIIPKDNVILRGVNKKTVKLQKATGTDWIILNLTGTLTNFKLKNFTFDILNTESGSGVQLRDAVDCVVKNCHFQNGTDNGWFLFFGSEPSDTSTFIGQNNKIIDCSFDNHSGSLEMLLAFNQNNLEVVRPVFTNNLSGPVFGLWQKCYNTKIISPYYEDCSSIAFYYSITCDNMIIENPVYVNTQAPIQGSNVSDNGDFGEDFARNLKIINPILIGGADTTTSIGIQIGAIEGVEIINPYITGYNVPMVFDGGNSPANYLARKITVINPHIFNNNQSDTSHAIHPGILFLADANHDWQARIIGGHIYDSQATKTQRYPIAFSGTSVVHSGVEIINVTLAADTANSGTSIIVNDGGSLGSNTFIRDCSDVTDTGVAAIDNKVINNALIYQKDGRIKLGANTIPDSGVAFQIGNDGVTQYMQFGDSVRMRGNNGNTDIKALFDNKDLRIISPGDVATVTISFSDGDIVTTGTLTASNLSGNNTGDQTLNSLLPSQAGNSGRALVTNGTDASWQPISGTGAVDSVNGQTGTVVIDADDINDASTTNKFATAEELADIALNTADRHEAVSVTDSDEINFTLTGQNITASLVASSIDESKLDASVNSSLDLAESALQSSDIGTVVQEYSSVLENTTASFTTADETKLDGIAPGAEVNVNADWNAVSGDATILNKPSIPSQYTDELAQDAVGNILDDGGDIDFTYNDATPSITAAVKNDSVTYSKIQNVSATDKVLGRVTAGAGDVEEISTTGSGNVVRATSPTITTPVISGKAQLDANFGAITSNTDGATITFNLNTSNQHSVVLGGNRTLALSNPSVGQTFSLLLIQDATGSRTVTWFSGITWATGSAPTLKTAANAVNTLIFYCTGSGAYQGYLLF